ncbi:unnamed protein product [Rotaria magnacalcarata]|uniref:Uncharacterized protein n=1 Tax=Rotaria magnacalcarata TaxID=392030 RepID=A0A816QBD5_9BILA|nr:unnamed protein product [Rotaria magnacalcarata]
MRLQDISSVEYLLDVGDIFALLNLDSNELIQIKKKAGIFLNNRSYILKIGILYKVQTFINILNGVSRKHVNYSDRQSSNESCNLTVPEGLIEKLPFIRTLITYSSLVVNSKADFTLLNTLFSNMFRNLGIADKCFHYEPILRQFATALYVLGGRRAHEFLRLNIPSLLPSVQILQAAISAAENNVTEGKFNYESACNYFNSIHVTLGFITEDATAVIPKITYDTTSDTFIGFVAQNKKDLDLIISQLFDLDLNDIKKKYQVKRQYFITYQSYFCIEINAHSLIYLATLVCEGKLSFEALNISLQNSQTCEGVFRSARAISSITSAGVNFTILQFLKRANKLAALQNIKNSSHENHLRFPQHHKLAKTNQVTSTRQDKNALSKKSIENAVLKAYKYVSNLFSQMNLKTLLRKGHFISIDEMSNIVLSSLDDFWSSDLGTINSETRSNEIGSENEINNEDQSNMVYDSDEEFELNDHLNVSDDINVSSYQGMRLFDNVEQELAHSYFKVSVNNESKYLHKQAACWILEKDKTSLSSNRLSRVQGR